MFKPARLRFTIEVLDEDGAGVGSPAALAGRQLHVPFALPGEEIIAEVEHESPHRPEAWGRLVELLVPAPARSPTECAAWGRCGGCVLQHLGYPQQLAFKRGRVEGALRAAGVLAPVEACVAASAEAPPRPYRNRSKLVFARAAERVILGAYAPRTHQVVDLRGCRVVIPPLDEIAGALARLATDLGVAPYQERSGDGHARYALLRAARDGTTQVLLVVSRRRAPGIAELASELLRERPEVRGVVENLQPSRGNVLIGDLEPDLVLAGEAALFERCRSRLRLSPRAFFQASWAGAEVLYAAAVRAAAPRPGDAVLDLFSGVGGIALSLALAEPGARIVGVEQQAEAVADAEAGRALNGADNADFVCADAVRLLRQRADHGERTDIVVVDPPRRGLAPAVIEALARLVPRTIVYVSCAPDTLARDLALLEQRGYRSEAVTPLDLMPDTPHVEAIAVLHR